MLVKSPSREGTKAQKRLLISKLPQVLHIVLRRFRSLPQTNLRRPSSRQARQLSHKITMHVNFDEYLNMAPYCKQSRNNSVPFLRTKPNEDMTSECFYRLRGVIVHYGKSINTGHFVAFVYNDLLGNSNRKGSLKSTEDFNYSTFYRWMASMRWSYYWTNDFRICKNVGCLHSCLQPLFIKFSTIIRFDEGSRWEI